MNNRWRAALTVIAITVGAAGGALAQRAAPAGPLTIASQGSFFVGGENQHVDAPPGAPANAGGDITVNQMYVQYQIPPRGARHVPVVMVHGCCSSSKTWETTPDGRMGWDEYFVRRERSLYLADQVSRARSGFDPSAIAAVKNGTAQPLMQDKNSDRLAELIVGWLDRHVEKRS